MHVSCCTFVLLRIYCKSIVFLKRDIKGWCTNCQNPREQQNVHYPRITLAMFVEASGGVVRGLWGSIFPQLYHLCCERLRGGTWHAWKSAYHRFVMGRCPAAPPLPGSDFAIPCKTIFIEGKTNLNLSLSFGKESSSVEQVGVWFFLAQTSISCSIAYSDKPGKLPKKGNVVGRGCNRCFGEQASCIGAKWGCTRSVQERFWGGAFAPRSAASQAWPS